MDMPKIQVDKYENAVLYFAKYCNNMYLGATKLNKLLYYLDFISHRDKGVTITGDQYIHKDYGPVPSYIDEIISELRSKNKLEAELKDFGENGKVEFKTMVDPDTSVFSKYELELIEKICREFALWSTEKIVSQTHLEAPWFYSKPYDVVDFKYSKDIDFFTS